MNKKELTWRIRVYGIVQGVGFRPTVSRHATSNGICGTVCNKGPYVEIYAQGQKKQMEGFLKALEVQPPKRAAILKINTEDVTAETDMHFETFNIIESEKTKGEIFVSPDIAICEECKEEMYDPKDRRYLHPFINCTCCGPRLTILDALPYDRERTSMKEFPMCPDCAEEYEDETTRRYDAQPVCCNKCGPEVYLIGRSERGKDAITYTRRMISEGKIVAIKGIGGFHLCCDATNEEAVQRLRTLKRRPAKPFAVMAKDESVVKRECVVTPEQEMILTGHQKPILLLDKENGGRLAPSIAPGNPKVGVMLPYAPVQLLIFQYDDGIEMPDILVMTSGNTSGAPICREDTEAVAELSHLCDAMLSHNRKIRIRADDTVMDFYKNEPYMIRRSRGYAPLPFMMSTDWKGKVLAVGGELKNTFCIGVDSRFYPSPYVGDLEDLRTVKALQETIQRFQTLLEVHPQVVVCDLHPKYNSTVVAEELGYPIVKVQHHYAHILSCMVENDCQEPVIGVAFDGTGYGTDGTIWGGEILLADYEDFTRFGNITPFLQIGGDVSAKEGWRIAVSMIYGYTKDRELAGEIMKKLDLCSEKESKVQFAMADRKLNAVLSTSVGRLFDAVSAILGIRHKSSFEGEASMALEFAAEAYEQKDHEQKQNEKIDPLVYEEDGHVILNTQLLVQRIVEAKLQGADSGRLAYWFHEILAEQITAVCVEARNVSGRQKAVLSGGVFQNRLLLRLTEERLTEEGFEVLRHRMVPPNDGGIAVGQAAYGMAQLFRAMHMGSE
ncbi:carbamoyltransferase HypF [Clostridiaceae bacterium AM27-36LB]|nr:carbamoyltransferase HypF [Clostridiales bacterium AM23-16LB]RHR45298.1 carbamoyltransferase HypF [Clostridiaceae bacterium AF18-31LB]RHT83821.1 carbamoyltransferase HypF [Clostridiaceae bacterium AM27-36LB]RHW04870.1 carbamoyltransferase HypF [Clostridiaceae bacterium OF09-1]